MAVASNGCEAARLKLMSENDWLEVVTRHDPWDVVILGAGPAGAIAARQLARERGHVLLVEKSQLPRSKVCGGCLGGVALDVLEQVGLGDLPVKCGGITLQKMQLASGGSVAQIEIGRRVALSRQTFDAALTREAIQSGATLCTETTGSLKPSAELCARSLTLRHRGLVSTIRAKVVIVATGLATCAPDFFTRIPPTSRIGLGAVIDHSPVFVESGTLYMACGVEGYVGIAPIEGGQIDIAAAVDVAALGAGTPPGKLISGILEHAGLPLPGDLDQVPWRGTPPLTRKTYPLGSNRCLLVGDAAGYVEPFTGEGIGWALMSAVLACSLLANGLDVWDDRLPDRWKQIHDQAFGRHQRSCRQIVQLLRSKTVRKVVIWGLHRAPSLARPIVRRLDHLR
jgi:flavin-dependent dehydrogenase